MVNDDSAGSHRPVRQRVASRAHNADRFRCDIFWLLLAGIAALSVDVGATEDPLIERMLDGNHVLVIRHAYAPGTGDPAGFRLGDCSTQRNLNEAGRKQAHAIGAWLRSHGIEHARVFSSQWCRCRETAELVSLGPVTELPALNSFYQRPRDREPNLAALRSFLAAPPPGDGLLILVTHQVTISALAGMFADSGHGVLLDLQEGGLPTVAGRIGFDE